MAEPKVNAEPTVNNDRHDFIDGRSANVDVYQSEKGMLVVATHHVENPFNHGDELGQERSAIAQKVCENYGCEPKDFQYVEQAGSHFQQVTLERNTAGEVQTAEINAYKTLRNDEVSASIEKNQSRQIGHEKVQEPEWASHLKTPDEQSHDR